MCEYHRPVLFDTLFFFSDTSRTCFYTLSLHDALPISLIYNSRGLLYRFDLAERRPVVVNTGFATTGRRSARSEEHTSEFQSRQYLVCRLLLEKKKKTKYHSATKKETHNYLMTTADSSL